MNKYIYLIAILFCYSCKYTTTKSDDIDFLINKMSIEEKIGQMTQLTLGFLSSNDNQHDGSVKSIDTLKLKKAVQDYKVGSIFNSAGSAYSSEKWHDIINYIQYLSQQNENKIPVLYAIDAIHGATYNKNSILFPHNIGLAATRNIELITSSAKATAKEVRASGIRWNFDPVLDVGREPLWPRFPETFGEDPFLVSTMGAAVVSAYENNGLKSTSSVASCVKHFTGYSVPKNGKDRTEAFISEVELWEYHILPFKKAIESGASTIMINSGSVNGIPIHGSYYFLNDVLRKKLGFKGLIVTDWQDIIRLHTRHKVAETPKEAVRIAINAGIDMSMVPNEYSFYELLLELVNEGKISEKRIDESVRRILELKSKVGLFDNPFVENIESLKIDTNRHQQIALQAARESITLLKNENNVLPLTKDENILVVGPASKSLSTLCGSWSYTWQGNVEREYPQSYKTIVDALKDKSSNLITNTKRGFDHKANFRLNITDNIDKIILCLGENAYAESPGVIDDLTLDKYQLLLAKEAIKSGIPVVLVLTQGRPRIINSIVDEIDGIVLAFQPGSEGANAIADILYGVYNPSGILPFSYPRFSGDMMHYDYKFSSAIQQRKPGSITYDGYNPQWEFGFGLSYTNFEIDSLHPSSLTINEGDTLIITTTIRNTGKLQGDKSVDLFVSDEYATISPHNKKLKSFKKVDLEAGESKALSFLLTTDDFTFIDDSGNAILEKGSFSIDVLNQKIKIEIN